jgi:hypothetical protein
VNRKKTIGKKKSVGRKISKGLEIETSNVTKAVVRMQFVAANFTPLSVGLTHDTQVGERTHVKTGCRMHVSFS